MNFFFGIKSSILDSKLTIPRFQNSGLVKKEYTALKLEIKNHSWKIHRLVDDVWKKVDYSDKYYKSIAAHDSLMALKSSKLINDFYLIRKRLGVEFNLTWTTKYVGFFHKL